MVKSEAQASVNRAHERKAGNAQRRQLRTLRDEYGLPEAEREDPHVVQHHPTDVGKDKRLHSALMRLGQTSIRASFSQAKEMTFHSPSSPEMMLQSGCDVRDGSYDAI